MKKNTPGILKSLITYSILFVTIISIIPYPSGTINLLKYIDSTVLWWSISFLILIVLLYSIPVFCEKQTIKQMRYVTYYLIWNCVCIIWGGFIAEGYWGWKGLVGNGMALLLPLIAYVSTHKYVTQSVYGFYFKAILPLFFVVIFLISSDTFGFYLMPLTVLIFFLPALKNKNRVIIIFFSLLVIFINLGARSNVIKFSVPFILLLFYLGRNVISSKLLEFIRFTLIILPFVFFILALTGVFNLFRMDDYIKGNFIYVEEDAQGRKEASNLKDDTRTKLYEDVITTSYKRQSFVFGSSPARGNETDDFDDISRITGKSERLGNEVAILNIFSWTGIIGVILYMLVFYKASYLAVNHSNNIYIRLIGLFVAFRWFYSWVEDINYFTLNTFVLWMLIGVCYSESFRSMTNAELKIWARGIFDFRYALYSKYLSPKKKIG